MKQLREMTDVELAWLAGIVDGEGCITLSRPYAKAKWKTPQMSIASTSYELLRTILDLTGIGVISQKKKYVEHHRQSYTWQINSGGHVINFCKVLLPFLREAKKWKRAKKFASEWKSVTPRNGRYSEKMARKKQLFQEEFFTL